MKQIKKWIQCSIIFLFIIQIVGCEATVMPSISREVVDTIQDKKEIIWGVKYDTRLFGMMNIKTGEVEGFDIDIAKAITNEILGPQGKATFIEVTSKTRIPMLKNGNIDAIIASMTISKERLKQVDFSNVYFNGGQSLLVKKGSPIKNVTDLTKNNTVLAIKGSTSAKKIREHAPEAKVIELENYAEGFTALQSRQGDALTTDSAILLGMVAQNNEYEVTGNVFTEEPYGIAINKKQERFVQKVNEALQAIHKSGEYDRIYHKWFPTDDQGMVK